MAQEIEWIFEVSTERPMKEFTLEYTDWLKNGKEDAFGLLSRSDALAEALRAEKGAKTALAKQKDNKALALLASFTAKVEDSEKKVRLLIGTDEVEGLRFTADPKDHHAAERSPGSKADGHVPHVHKMERFMSGGYYAYRPREDVEMT
ncbi:MAG: hypothetical protein L6R39_004588 [Caloplaca ligustica]|nr:MAG: hypothetical protein L6R39_004588 [Caloplaca ligustica]